MKMWEFDYDALAPHFSTDSDLPGSDPVSDMLFRTDFIVGTPPEGANYITEITQGPVHGRCIGTISTVFLRTRSVPPGGLFETLVWVGEHAGEPVRHESFKLALAQHIHSTHDAWFYGHVEGHGSASIASLRAAHEKQVWTRTWMTRREWYEMADWSPVERLCLPGQVHIAVRALRCWLPARAIVEYTDGFDLPLKTAAREKYEVSLRRRIKVDVPR